MIGVASLLFVQKKIFQEESGCTVELLFSFANDAFTFFPGIAFPQICPGSSRCKIILSEIIFATCNCENAEKGKRNINTKNRFIEII